MVQMVIIDSVMIFWWNRSSISKRPAADSQDYRNSGYTGCNRDNFDHSQAMVANYSGYDLGDVLVVKKYSKKFIWHSSI